MNRTSLIVCVLSVVVLAGAPSAKATPLAESLPADTLAYVGWSGKSITFDGSMLGQLLAEPDLAAMIASLEKDMLDEMPAGPAQDTAKGMRRMLGLAWKHPLAIAVRNVKFTDMGPMPQLIVLVDLGKQRDAFDKHLQRTLAALPKELEVKSATHAGTEYRLMGDDKQFPVLAVGYIKEVFFLTVGEASAKELIDRAAGNAASKSLAQSKAFADAMEAVSGPNEQMAIYMDVARLRDETLPKLQRAMAGQGDTTTGPDQPGPLQKIFAEMGYDKATVLAGATCVVDRGMYSKTKLFSPAPHKGQLALAGGAPVADKDLADVPADADGVAVCNISASQVYKYISGLASSATGAPVDKQLKGIEDEIGISIEKDILGSLGDTWVLASAPSLGGFGTGTVLSAEVTDEKKLAAALDKLREFARKQTDPDAVQTPPADPNDPAPMRTHRRRQPSMQFHTDTDGRYTIHYVTFPDSLLPVAPAWCVHKGKFYLAPYPQVLQTALARNGSAKPITGSETFAAFRKQVSPKSSTLVYVNTPALIRKLYNAALVVWTMGVAEASPRSDFQPKLTWLPSILKLEKYLWPCVMGMHADEAGVVVESYGSLPTGGIEAGVLLAPMLAPPAMMQARIKANEAYSRAELYGLSRAIILWQCEHNNQFPPDLLSLEDAKYIRLNKDLKQKITTGQVAYIGRGNMDKVRNPSQVVMLYSRLPAGKMAVMFVDGHVEMVSAKRLANLLKESAKAYDNAE